MSLQTPPFGTRPRCPSAFVIPVAFGVTALLLITARAAAVEVEPGWPQTTGYSVSQSGAPGQFDDDPEWEIAIASQDGYAYVYNHDGTLVPGWPRYMGGALGPDPYANQCSSPAVADLDGDGGDDVVVGCFDGRVYAFRADGTLLPGWPVTTGWMVFSTPAVGDIDGDDRPEVVFGSNDGGIYAVNHDGTLCPGFPVDTPYVVRSSAALGDLDGDGKDEIVITADNTERHLYVLDGDGTLLPGFPPLLGPTGSNSSPAIGDVDGDGEVEIVVGARDGSLHVFHLDGSYASGWPLDAGYSLQSSPTLVDLDGEPGLEIVVGLNDSKVSIYRGDGSLLPGWPQTTSYSVLSSASVGDIDGDGGLEIVIGENTGKVYAWNIDGTLVPGFPLEASYTIYSSPLLEDLDGDGSLELLVGCNDTKIYCWDLGPGTWNPDLLPWPQWRLRAVKDAYVAPDSPTGIASDPDADGMGRDGVALGLREATCALLAAPNPTAARTTIRVLANGRTDAPDRIPADGIPAVGIPLRIYSVSGRLVRSLAIPPVGAGSVDWDTRDEAGTPVAAGVYLCRRQGRGTPLRILVVR